ncbi:MAG TPA: PKD domain-containing protein [Candidatus Brocadiia bacterium]|nr:PKD domain-containing protein [Candidatus Brocadiales bacterium]
MPNITPLSVAHRSSLIARCTLLIALCSLLIAFSTNPSFAYKYGGVKWPDTDIPVGYYINANTNDVTDEALACQSAAQTWSSVPTSSFAFQYLGSTTRLAPSYNGYNDLSWGSTGGSIATTYIWYMGSTIIECDMEFEDGYNWGTNGASNLMDVQNIATHEFGHFLLLLDLYDSADSEKTMYGYGRYGETKKRTLDPDDIAGISFIYPATDGTTITADFTASTRSGYAPLTVRFTDLSTGNVNGWLWDFGDGTPVSTSQNPSHTYDSPGYFTVTLEVTGENGSDTITKTDYIKVYQPVVTPVITTISPNSGPVGTVVTIYGSGFGTTQGQGYVRFYKNRRAPILSWDDDKIECIVPSYAKPGYVFVKNNSNKWSNKVYFNVTGTRNK